MHYFYSCTSNSITMKKLLFPILLLISIGAYNQSIERSVVASAGNNATSETISISWTLGEIAASSLTSPGLYLSQGFHQGNLLIDAIEGAYPGFLLKTYPNPVIDKLIVESSKLNQLYEIIDINGRVLINGFITSNPFDLDFTDLASGVYFFRVEHRTTHKIIKK